MPVTADLDPWSTRADLVRRRNAWRRRPKGKHGRRQTARDRRLARVRRLQAIRRWPEWTDEVSRVRLGPFVRGAR